MIGRVGELLAEFVDIARAARALPHVIETDRELELRVRELEGQSERLKEAVGALAEAAADQTAVLSELYLASSCDSEVPDA